MFIANFVFVFGQIFLWTKFWNWTLNLQEEASALLNLSNITNTLETCEYLPELSTYEYTT